MADILFSVRVRRKLLEDDAESRGLLTSRAPRPENGPGPSQNPADVAWRRKNKKPAGRLASKQQQQQKCRDFINDGKS
tara:strand:+ start:808 stop:1041 length:234 start_codon:yes stop_codon:yes gene_type:complete